MTKRLWILPLALGLILGLAACGGDTAPSPEDVSPTEAVATTEPEEATPAPATPETGTESDANDSPERAAEISVGTYTDSLDEGTEDWYTFEVVDGDVLSVQFTAGEDADDLHVQLLDPDQNRVWQERYIGPTVTKSTRQMMSSASGGMYYLQVSGGHGEYTVELATESQNDAGSGDDAGDEVTAALPVGVNQTVSGEIGDFDEEDWYTFEVADGDVLTVQFTAGEEADELHVQLMDPDQNRVWQERYIGPTVTKSTRQMMSSTSGGTYYLQVSGGHGEYAVELATESQDDAGSGGDAADGVADALPVDVNQTLSGEIGDFDGEDWYTFEVADGDVLSVQFTAGEDADELHVQLMDPDQNRVWQERYIGPTVTKSTRQIMGSASGGMYYVQVSGGHGQYSVELATGSQDDAGTGGDAGDRVADALAVEVGQTPSGEIGGFDEEDWYAFDVTEGDVLSVQFTAGEDADELHVQLLDPDQNRVWQERYVGPTETRSTEITDVVGGTYYIQISGGAGSYTVEID